MGAASVRGLGAIKNLKLLYDADGNRSVSGVVHRAAPHVGLALVLLGLAGAVQAQTELKVEALTELEGTWDYELV